MWGAEEMAALPDLPADLRVALSDACSGGLQAALADDGKMKRQIDEALCTDQDRATIGLQAG